MEVRGWGGRGERREREGVGRGAEEERNNRGGKGRAEGRMTGRKDRKRE